MGAEFFKVGLFSVIFIIFQTINKFFSLWKLDNWKTKHYFFSPLIKLITKCTYIKKKKHNITFILVEQTIDIILTETYLINLCFFFFLAQIVVKQFIIISKNHNNSFSYFYKGLYIYFYLLSPICFFSFKNVQNN